MFGACGGLGCRVWEGRSLRAAGWVDFRAKLWPWRMGDKRKGCWRKLMGSVTNSDAEMPGIPQWGGLGGRLELC